MTPWFSHNANIFHRQFFILLISLKFNVCTILYDLFTSFYFFIENSIRLIRRTLYAVFDSPNLLRIFTFSREQIIAKIFTWNLVSSPLYYV